MQFEFLKINEYFFMLKSYLVCPVKPILSHKNLGSSLNLIVLNGLLSHCVFGYSGSTFSDHFGAGSAFVFKKSRLRRDGFVVLASVAFGFISAVSDMKSIVMCGSVCLTDDWLKFFSRNQHSFDNRIRLYIYFIIFVIKTDWHRNFQNFEFTLQSKIVSFPPSFLNDQCHLMP